MQNYCIELDETMKFFKSSYEEFRSNNIFKNSVSMIIFQIGELVNHLSPEYLELTKDKMNWNVIRGMRNHFAHGYFNMNTKIIFDTAMYDIPNLHEFINKEIKSLNENI